MDANTGAVSILYQASKTFKVFSGATNDARFSAGSNGTYVEYGVKKLSLTSNEVSLVYSGDSHKYFKSNGEETTISYLDGRYVSAARTETRLQYGSYYYLTCNYNGIEMKAGGYTATFTDSGGWNPSDRRLKEDIEYYVDGDIVDKLKPARFKYKGGSKLLCGFIAQDVIEVMPDIVYESKFNEEHYLGLNYESFSAILTAKLQKHTRIIKEQEDRIAELERQIREVRNDG